MAAIANEPVGQTEPSGGSVELGAAETTSKTDIAMTENTAIAAKTDAVRPDKRMLLATRYIQSNQFVKAQAAYQAILRDRPRDVRALSGLARLGISLRDSGIIKVALAGASDLDPGVLATCVGHLIKSGEVFALRDMVLAHREAAEPLVPRVVRLCRDLLRTTTVRSERVALHRCLLDIEPDDVGAKVGLVRLFESEIAACKTLSGQALIDATYQILQEDPENAAAARMLAQACVDAGMAKEAFDTLSKLRDSDLVVPRTIAMYLAASQASNSLLDHARAILRVSKIAGAPTVQLVRSARAGLRPSRIASEFEATALFAEVILANEPADESGLTHKKIATNRMAKIVGDAIKAGDIDTLKRVMEYNVQNLADPSRRAAARYIDRQSRRAAIEARQKAVASRMGTHLTDAGNA